MFQRREHPDEERLLRFSEGTMKERERRGIERHVQGCWECRTHLDEVQFVIGAYVRYRENVLKPAMPAPPSAWRNLESEMLRIRNREAQESGTRTAWIPWRWIVAALAAASVAAAIYVAELRMGSGGHEKLPGAAAETIHPAAPAPSGVGPDRHTAVPSRVPGIVTETVSPDDEVNVIEALHRMNADLGDPVSVIRQRDRIVVNVAGVDDPERVNRIREALKAIRNVEVDANAPQSPGETSAVTERAASPPKESLLVRQFADVAAYQQFVDRTLDSADAVMTWVHALRSLAERFSPSVEAQLTTGARATLASIRQDHAAALAESIRSLDQSLSRVLPAVSSGSAVLPAENWQDATRDLFTIAQRTDRLIAEFLGATTPDGATVTATDVAQSLAQLKAKAAAYPRA